MGRKRNDEAWLPFYKKLIQYYQEHGNIRIPPKYVTADGVKLGSWFKKQKELYSKGLLIDERIELLEKLPITWNVFEDEWNKHYAYLKKYYEAYGNSDVPRNYVTPDGFNLGNWISDQRIAYKNRVLSKRRKKLLKEVDFKLSPSKDKWDDFYYMLEDYFNNHGDTDVPYDYVIGEHNLGRWVVTQRQAYNATSTATITKDHIMLLNDLGFDWSRRDTQVLNSLVTRQSYERYNRVMLNRMKHILEDLSYEVDGEIKDMPKQKTLEDDIVRRMWK